MTMIAIAMGTAMATMTTMVVPITAPVDGPFVPVPVFLHSFSLKEVMATEQELSMVSRCSCTEMRAPE